MKFSGGRRHSGVRLFRLIAATLLVGAVLVLPSCVGEGDFPEIVSMTVDPASIPQSDTGMTDETVDVTMQVSGFTGQIVEADAYIQLQAGPRTAQKQDFVVEGNTITLVGITKSWFSGLEPGDYSIGAQVVSDSGEDITQGDLATVSITP